MSSYNLYSDSNLLAHVKAGDNLAFTEIYNRYWAILYAYACKSVDNHDDAEDIIQDIFVTLWNNAGAVELTDTLSAYLYTAVKYKILDRISHREVRAKYAQSLQKFMEEGVFLTDEKIRESELIKQIEAGLSKLPEKMRQIFELSRNDHLSHKEIAAKLNISDKTVKKQISNALKLLRSKINFIWFF